MSKSRVLFAWEAGENLGHVLPMARIAKALPENNTQCFFAVRDIVSGQLALADTGIPLFQAPYWPRHTHSGNQDGQASYADILALIGFGDSRKLSAMLGAWSALLDMIRPDLVVADHCPSLLPLLHARNIASVAVGTGFTMPPLDYASLPPLRADRGPLLPEQKLLESLATALGLLGFSPPPRLTEAFRSLARVVFSFPELDAYRSWRREPLFLPPEPLPPFAEPPLAPHLFVYAGSEFPGIDELVRVLGTLPITVTCFLRDAAPALNAFLRIRGITAFDQPPTLADILPTVSHVLSQGGNFMSHAAMAAGRPHLILPLQGETQGNLQALEALGIARILKRSPADQLGLQIGDFVAQASLLSKARQWSNLVAERGQANGLEAALAAINELLASR